MGSDINVLSKITEQKILYLMLVAGLAANAALVTYSETVVGVEVLIVMTVSARSLHKHSTVISLGAEK